MSSDAQADTLLSFDHQTPARYNLSMTSARYVYWQDGEMWLGYLEEYPDYQTQGESLDDLRDQLKELLTDLTSGVIPGVRRVAQLQLA